MSDLSPGQIVTGVVVEHRHFGVFVDIGEAELAVAVITMLEDEPRSRDPVMPPVGNTVEAVFLGYSGPGHQPRLSLRPGDVEKARAAG
jgi:ribosomal protein S1